MPNTYTIFFSFKGDVLRSLKEINSPPKAFTGIINLNENLEKFGDEKFISRYRNTMIVSDFKSELIKKLVNVSIIFSSFFWNYIIVTTIFSVFRHKSDFLR